jgi:hypothetical protein
VDHLTPGAGFLVAGVAGGALTLVALATSVGARPHRVAVPR